MHSVGFYHEHERWDRDSHITILWQNIDREAYDQFGKVDLSESSYYGQMYDYYSIMHYDSLAFSKNGFETMVAKRPEMTATDILKMNLMYQCGQRIVMTKRVCAGVGWAAASRSFSRRS
ncbi:astacin [Cooperia oncophora]